MNKPAVPDRFLRDVLIVAGQELAESLRTKRALLLMVLFSGITVFVTFLFTKMLISLEKEVVSAIGLEAGATGGASNALWKNKHFQNMLTSLMDGDSEAAQMLLQFSPMGLFYGWIMINMAPWLVALTSSARITEEIWSGAARFVLCRTTRMAWVLGKYLGQSLQLLLALLLTVLAGWTTAWFRLESFDMAQALRDMLLFAPKAWIYGMAFLGMVSGISMFCRSPGIANVLGIVGYLIATSIYYTARANAGEGWRRLLDGVQLVLPQHHYFALMYPDWEHTVPATVFLLALGLTYLFIGYTRLARKDL